jgi:speckle-type POZ protein
MRTTDYRAGGVVPPSDLHRQLTEVLWESKEGVDVEIEVGGETFPAHRWMLAARSPVFKAELLQSSAALSSRIRVDNMDPGVFKVLLHFIYTDALPKEIVERQETLATTMAKPLLLAADRYKLERLKLICEDILCGHIDVKSVGATLAFADQHSCRMLKEACMEFLADPANLEAAVSTRAWF